MCGWTLEIFQPESDCRAESERRRECTNWKFCENECWKKTFLSIFGDCFISRFSRFTNEQEAFPPFINNKMGVVSELWLRLFRSSTAPCTFSYGRLELLFRLGGARHRNRLPLVQNARPLRNVIAFLAPHSICLLNFIWRACFPSELYIQLVSVITWTSAHRCYAFLRCQRSFKKFCISFSIHFVTRFFVYVSFSFFSFFILIFLQWKIAKENNN